MMDPVPSPVPRAGPRVETALDRGLRALDGGGITWCLLRGEPATDGGRPPLPVRTPRSQQFAAPARPSGTPDTEQPVAPPTARPAGDWEYVPLSGVPYWNDPSHPSGPLEPMDPLTPAEGFGAQEPSPDPGSRPYDGSPYTAPGHQGGHRER